MSGGTSADAQLSGAEATESLAAELTAAAARFFAAELGEPHRTARDPAGAYRLLRPGLADLGLLGLPPDPAFGGAGAPRLTTPLFQLAGRALVPGPLLEDVVLVPALTALLPSRAAELAARAPLAFVDGSGPGAGLRLGGGLLTGRSGPLPHGCDVDWLLIAARSRSGPRLLLLSSDHPGVSIVAVKTMDPCSTACEISFDSPTGPADLLGVAAATQDLLVTVRSLARLALSAELQGIADHLTEVTVKYALERQQFGRPIGSFQSVKHILAAMARDVLALGNLVSAVARRLPADLASMALWCAIAKSHASKTAVQIAAAALQVHGGIGFTEEHALQLYYKRALAVESRFGQSAELNAFIGAARVTGEPLIC